MPIFFPYIINIESQAEAATILRRLGVSGDGVTHMAAKALGRVIHVSGLEAVEANILKQEMLSMGGDAALPANVWRLQEGNAESLVMGTPRQFEDLVPRLQKKPFRLPRLGEEIAACSRRYEAAMNGEVTVPARLGKQPWLVMGILNVTPDSFHDRGRYGQFYAAVERAREMAAAGAAIIDVGGESTRPGAAGITLKEELGRVVPVVEALAAELKIPISVDTCKAGVARAALEAGAAMINDITALRGDRTMARVAAEHGCPVCLMHMQGTPRDMQKNPRYRDVVGDLAGFFLERVEWAERRGIRRENIILDPGIGFGKKLEHNLSIIRRLDSFLSLGLPVMIGASRKSFLGKISRDRGTEERLIGTVAANTIAYGKGARIFRVHDVAENVQALKVAAATREAR